MSITTHPTIGVHISGIVLCAPLRPNAIYALYISGFAIYWENLELG